MVDDLGRHLFTFAAITDSHVNEAEDRSVSPYACNRLANGRFRWVVHCLNRHRPAFTVHLGDMGNPLPELPSYERAAERFRAIAGELSSPLHLVAGNHCVGDKPTGWVPVPRVSPGSLARFERVYGRHYYAFDHGPCRFLVLDSLVVNSGLEHEAAQRAWVEAELAATGHAGRRLWIFMHYPPFIAEADEPGSYDNLDEPGRSWLLGLLERYDVEAAFSGHVHNYFYNRWAGTELVTVPASSFVRQDYSDLFRVPPEDEEGGRNDTAKLGYCLVRVHAKGHVHEIVRTGGRVLVVGEEPGPRGARRGAAAPEPLGGAARSRAGVEMRENWLLPASLRSNNSVSPFTRRTARNDWAVLALREMGVFKVRLALQELFDPQVIERLRTLQEAGFELLVFSHGVPGVRAYHLVREHRALLAGWELILSARDLEPAVRRVRKILRSPSQGALPCYLSEVRDVRRAEVEDANVRHEAIYGFQAQERERIERLGHRDDVRGTFAGLVFRLRRRGEPRVAPWAAIAEVGTLGREQGLRHQVHVLFSGSLTSDRLVDDLATANRVAESALAAALAGGVDLYFDTFEDVDRGYFVRHGLVDGRYNPRPAARVLRHLEAALATCGPLDVHRTAAEDAAWGRQLSVEHAGGVLALVAPGGPVALEEMAAVGRGERPALTFLDLESGARREVAVTAEGPRWRFAEPVAVGMPTLVIGR